MEDKKYILTDETQEVKGHILHRIQAVRSFRDVEEGDLGGWIEKEKNLSHEGNCWVGEEACIFEDARVEDNAQVRGNSIVNDHAQVYGEATVRNKATVVGYAKVYDQALVTGSTSISDYANIYGNARIFKYAHIGGEASIFEYASVSDMCKVYENAKIHGYAAIAGKASIFGSADVSGILTAIDGNARIYSGEIDDCGQYITIGPIGSRNDYTTFFRGKNDQILVACGCFQGYIQTFRNEVQKKHGNNMHGKDYMQAISMAMCYFGARE